MTVVKNALERVIYHALVALQHVPELVLDAIRGARGHVQVAVKVRVASHVEQAANLHAQNNVLDVARHAVLHVRHHALRRAVENVCPHVGENVGIIAVMLACQYVQGAIMNALVNVGIRVSQCVRPHAKKAVKQRVM